MQLNLKDDLLLVKISMDTLQEEMPVMRYSKSYWKSWSRQNSPQKFKKFLLDKESDKNTILLLTASDVYPEILSEGLG
jgi:hypothetical protein